MSSPRAYMYWLLQDRFYKALHNYVACKIKNREDLDKKSEYWAEVRSAQLDIEKEFKVTLPALSTSSLDIKNELTAKIGKIEDQIRHLLQDQQKLSRPKNSSDPSMQLEQIKKQLTKSNKKLDKVNQEIRLNEREIVILKGQLKGGWFSAKQRKIKSEYKTSKRKIREKILKLKQYSSELQSSISSLMQAHQQLLPIVTSLESRLNASKLESEKDSKPFNLDEERSSLISQMIKNGEYNPEKLNVEGHLLDDESRSLNAEMAALESSRKRLQEELDKLVSSDNEFHFYSEDQVREWVERCIPYMDRISVAFSSYGEYSSEETEQEVEQELEGFDLAKMSRLEEMESDVIEVECVKKTHVKKGESVKLTRDQLKKLQNGDIVTLKSGKNVKYDKEKDDLILGEKSDIVTLKKGDIVKQEGLNFRLLGLDGKEVTGNIPWSVFPPEIPKNEKALVKGKAQWLPFIEKWLKDHDFIKVLTALSKEEFLKEFGETKLTDEEIAALDHDEKPLSAQIQDIKMEAQPLSDSLKDYSRSQSELQADGDHEAATTKTDVAPESEAPSKSLDSSAENSEPEFENDDPAISQGTGENKKMEAHIATQEGELDLGSGLISPSPPAVSPVTSPVPPELRGLGRPGSGELDVGSGLVSPSPPGSSVTSPVMSPATSPVPTEVSKEIRLLFEEVENERGMTDIEKYRLNQERIISLKNLMQREDFQTLPEFQKQEVQARIKKLEQSNKSFLEALPGKIKHSEQHLKESEARDRVGILSGNVTVVENNAGRYYLEYSKNDFQNVVNYLSKTEYKAFDPAGQGDYRIADGALKLDPPRYMIEISGNLKQDFNTQGDLRYLPGRYGNAEEIKAWKAFLAREAIVVPVQPAPVVQPASIPAGPPPPLPASPPPSLSSSVRPPAGSQLNASGKSATALMLVGLPGAAQGAQRALDESKARRLDLSQASRPPIQVEPRPPAVQPQPPKAQPVQPHPPAVQPQPPKEQPVQPRPPAQASQPSVQSVKPHPPAEPEPQPTAEQSQRGRRLSRF